MMEMPEGWKRILKTEFQKLSIEGPKQPFKYLDDFKYGLDLMKEMAEALELADKIIMGSIPDTLLTYREPSENELTAGRVLKKFKEWK